MIMTFHHTYPVQLRFSDVDQLGHVNNSVYFSLYDLAKTAYLSAVLGEGMNYRHSSLVIANINANFFVPVFFTDQIAVGTATIHLGHKSFTLLQRAVCAVTGEVKCECRTVMVAYDVEASRSFALPGEWREALARFEKCTVEELEAGR